MVLDAINTYCKTLRLPTVAQIVDDALATARREDWSLEAFLLHLLEQEMEGRRERRITRSKQLIFLRERHWKPLSKSGYPFESGDKSHSSAQATLSIAQTISSSLDCRELGKPTWSLH
jgi:DNA replication protein DnaC